MLWLQISLTTAGTWSHCADILGSAPQSALKRSQDCKAPSQVWSGCAGGEGERLLLWVLDGLAGVVISAVPNNVVGSKLLSSPRAVLWGEHQGLLSWPPSSGGAPSMSVSCLLFGCNDPQAFNREKLTDHYCVISTKKKEADRAGQGRDHISYVKVGVTDFVEGWAVRIRRRSAAGFQGSQAGAALALCILSGCAAQMLSHDMAKS